MSLEQLKSILYEVITADDSDGQNNLEPMIKATQQMGVSVSSAVTKNGGVRIFQLQNVVQQKVIKNVVNALRLIDSMELALPEPTVIDVVPEDDKKEERKTLGDEIEEALDNESSYAEFLSEVARQFVFAASTRYETNKETASAIKISYSKFMQVKRSTS